MKFIVLIRYVFLGLMFTGIFSPAAAQQYLKTYPYQPALPPIDSSKGFSLPAFDTLKALVILVQFPGEQEIRGMWPADSLTRIPELDLLLATSKDSFPEKSLTHYFQEASQGRFYYWGEFYPFVVQLDSPPSYYHKHGQYGATNAEALRKVIDSGLVDWNDFDRWGKDKRTGHYRKKPDGEIDNIAILYRLPPTRLCPECTWIGHSGGVAMLYGNRIHLNDSLSINTGSLGSGLYLNVNNSSINGLRYLYRHELAHFLTRHHYASVNDRYGNDYVLHSSWGLAALSGSASDAANAWDRFYMGWGEYNVDMVPGQEAQELVLRDFITTGNMARIALPHVPDEYFLLEFHANKAAFNNVDQGATGLYIFHQTRENGPHHLDLEEADGNFDYALADTIRHPVPDGTKHLPLLRLAPNPFLGFGDRDAMKLDKDGDDKVGQKDILKVLLYINSGIDTMPYFIGDKMDGFTSEQGRNIFSLSTNPSTASNGTRKDRPVVHISGIHIEVLEMDSQQVRLRMGYGDFDLDRPARWTGDIRLHDSLVVKEDQMLLLNESGTAIRENQVPPQTRLVFTESGSITLEKKATLIIEDDSELDMGENGKIWLMKKSKLIIGKNGRIVGNPEAIRLIGKKAEVHYLGR
ncbi:MAG: hypothetical protein WD077_02705 [Bacteroidia bacterium]